MIQKINNRYSFRLSFVFFFFLCAYGFVLFRLYCVQIKNSAFYSQLGKNQYRTIVKINPPRGAITDRAGKFLAMNKDSIAAFCLPNQIKDVALILDFFKKHFPDKPELAEQLLTHRDKLFMYIERRLSDAKIELIKNSNLEDIHLLCEPSRYYPIASAGHIIGTTNVDNAGTFGIELLFNEQLSGTQSQYLLQKDARSGYYHFMQQLQYAGCDGKPLQLTIDSDLQFLLHEQVQETLDAFQAKEGAAIVMDPQTGHIIAMVSIPTFDPNNTKNLMMEHTKNKTITENYEFGSVIKIFGALAALDEGAVTLDELIDCENVATTYIDGRKINTVRSSIAGVIPFEQVIEKSNNIGIAKVVNRIGPKLYDHYVRMGFGKKTGIEFPGERAGFVNPPSRWSRQSIFSLSYGYEITATLLQLARAFAIIARDGVDVQPTLIMPDKPACFSKPFAPSLSRGFSLYSPLVMQQIKQILENTVLRGTAKRAQIKGYKVMSKTGTANLLENGVYTDKKGLYTCAGIVERDNYQRVIVTFIKESPLPNLYASTVAAPLFERIAEKILIHDKIL